MMNFFCNLFQYFAPNDYPCPPMRNPSDHFLCTINKDVDAVSNLIFDVSPKEDILNL